METDPKPNRNQRNRRRERAHQMHDKQNEVEESADECGESPPRTSKDKGRGKHRRRRNSSSNSFEEDIIDGFAIVSFRTIEELENVVKTHNHFKQYKEKEVPNNILPKEKPKHVKKKSNRKQNVNQITPAVSDESQTTEEADGEDKPQTNGPSHPPRCVSRDRLSDTSTHSSSGQGYIPECDSASDDDKASESGSDLFTTVKHNRSITECQIPLLSVTPPPPTTTTVCNGTTVTTPTTTCGVTTATTTTATCSTPTTTAAATTLCRPLSQPLVSPVVVSQRPSPPPPPTLPPAPRKSPVPLSKTRVSPAPSQGCVNRDQDPVRHSSVLPRREDHNIRREEHVRREEHHLRREEHLRRETHPREREHSREREKELLHHPNNIYPSHLAFSKPSHIWVNSPASQLYSHSPSLHSPNLHSPLHHSLNSHASPFSHPAGPLPPHPPSAHPAAHSMFAPPIPPGPSPLTSSALTVPGGSHFGTESLIRSQDFLHQDLNNRLLAHNRETGSAPLGSSPYLRTETHQHQHQHSHLHNHQHMHQHTYTGIGPPPSLVPTPPPHLFDKIPKVYESGIFRPNASGLLPSASATAYPGFSSLLPAGPSVGHLSSGLHGAFQPKVRTLGPPGQGMFPRLDRDKPAVPTAVTSLPQQKKQGKWCAVHVRVAWEIYHHQQKQHPEKGAELKPGEPLRPPSHLLPGSSLPLHRPPELGPGTPVSLFGGVNPHQRTLLESHGGNPLYNPGLPPFPRPSPYPSLGGSLSFGGLGSSLLNSGREMGVVPGLTAPHEWNRLHRTPSSFPQLEREAERDRELERERERERERELERRKEEERERERRNQESQDRLKSLESERSRERYKEQERRRSRSRSRSRSPMRNGRIDHLKLDPGLLDRRYEEKLKVKEERREEDYLANSLGSNFEREREKFLRSNLVGFGQLHPAANPMAMGLSVNNMMLERSRFLAPTYFPMDRPNNPSSLWNPFDKSIAVNQQMELERERMALRLGAPMAVIEQERLKEQIMRDHEMELRRQYLERLPPYDRERLAFEQSKLQPQFRADPLGLVHYQRTMSPLTHNHGSKNGSPAVIPGVPPPLIPSASATRPHSHNNSPSSSKLKGCSPADSTSEHKDKRDTSSTDPDAHSR